MRKQAKIIRWEAGRGFGFMRCPDTPADVFFHVKDWNGRRGPPAVGLDVIYEELHVGGKGPRGVAVRPIDEESAPLRRPQRRQPKAAVADAHPGPMLLLMLAYAAVLMGCLITHRLP